MADIRKQCLQVGIIVGFGAFLIANATRLKPDCNQIATEPQLTAGAAKLPIVDWRTTEVKVVEPEPEIITVTEPEPEPEPQEVSQEIVEDNQEVSQGIDDLLYRVVQAEGYTMGYEGMRYITSAILNLARDRGCSVNEVLTSGAYTVVNNGMIWNQSLYPDTIAAVDDDLASQIDTEIKYFRTGHYHGFGTPVMQYGNVYFSK